MLCIKLNDAIKIRNFDRILIMRCDSKNIIVVAAVNPLANCFIIIFSDFYYTKLEKNRYT